MAGSTTMPDIAGLEDEGNDSDDEVEEVEGPVLGFGKLQSMCRMLEKMSPSFADPGGLDVLLHYQLGGGACSHHLART